MMEMETGTDNKQNKGRGKWIKRVSLFILFLTGILISFATGMYMSQRSETLEELTREGSIYVGKLTGKYSQEEEKLGENVDFDLYWEVWDTLYEQYVDKEGLNEKELFYGSLEGMARAVGDPYTVFMDPQESQEFDDSLNETSFEGIGAEIGIRNDVLTVVSPLKDAPAEKAGLQPGDRILAIDGTSTHSMNLDEAVRNIRGEKGTEVVLTIGREEFEEPRDIPISRGEIVVKSVRTRMEDDIFIIEITNFKNDTFQLFRESVQEAIAHNPRGIVLDLRNNPGGYLQGAVEIAGAWVEKGESVVVEDFGDGDKKEYRSQRSSNLDDFNTVVLINKGSASASEIVAGALRDHERAVIVGEDSFGKGSVQSLERLSHNTRLKITVAKWLTPEGTDIDKQGIEPDIEVEMAEEDYSEVRDPQLDKALEILKDTDFSVPYPKEFSEEKDGSKEE